MSDGQSPPDQTNGQTGEAQVDELQAMAQQTLNELRNGEVQLSPQLEQMRAAPLPVRLGAALGAIIAGGLQDLAAELVRDGTLAQGEQVPAEYFEAGVLKPLLWGIVAVAQQQGLELDAVTDEIVTAWTTPDEAQEGGQEGATETAGEGVTQQG